MNKLTGIAILCLIPSIGYAGGDSVPNKAYQECAKERHDLKNQLATERAKQRMTTAVAVKPTESVKQDEKGKWYPTVLAGVPLNNNGFIVGVGALKMRPGKKVMMVGGLLMYSQSEGDTVTYPMFYNKHPDTDEYGNNDYAPLGMKSVETDNNTVWASAQLVFNRK